MLRGSASPVLTATHHSYGIPRLSDFFPAHAWRSDPQPILTQNGSNDVDSRKDDTFAVKIATGREDPPASTYKYRCSEIKIRLMADVIHMTAL